MATTINETTLHGLLEEIETSEAVRNSQNAFLSELPGATFAVITLAYVMTSFLTLVW